MNIIDNNLLTMDKKLLFVSNLILHIYNDTGTKPKNSLNNH